LPQHVHHLHLEHGVDGLDADTGSALGHGEDVHHADCELIDELPQHQAHDLHGNACAAVPEHLEEGKGGDVDGFGVVDQAGVILRRA
jgi:hypothetical protein